jgi:hypothetical protein
MLAFSRDYMNIERMQFDNIVTTENMRTYLGYQIPENKSVWRKKGKPKKVQPPRRTAHEKSSRVVPEKSGRAAPEKSGRAAPEKSGRAASKPKQKAKKGPTKPPTKPATEVRRASFSEVPRGPPLEDPVDVSQGPTSVPVQTLLSELRRDKAAPSAQQMAEIEELLASVENEPDSDPESDHREDSAEPEAPRKKCMGDAIRAGPVGGRVKTVAQKKRKILDKGKAPIGENPKKMKGDKPGISMSVHLSDLIDEASEMYSEPSFPLPTPPIPSRDTLSRRGDRSPSVVIHDVPNDSDSAKSGHEDFIRDDVSVEPPIDETERVPDNLPDPPVGFPEASVDLQIPSSSRAEDIPASSQGPTPKQPEMASGETLARKPPIQSLRDGLLGCPLEALQALAPENYLRRPGVGRTSPERFADIIVHHQIEVCLPILSFVELSFFFFF